MKYRVRYFTEFGSQVSIIDGHKLIEFMNNHEISSIIPYKEVKIVPHKVIKTEPVMKKSWWNIF